MISTAEALDAIFDLVAPLDTETVPLRAATGRVLAENAVARRSQPPFRASVMDGYAVAADAAKPGAVFSVVGEAAAGTAFDRTVATGEAVRIFTGAPVPEGTDRVVIQEDVTRDGDRIILKSDLDAQPYVRPIGADFEVGHALAAPLRLGPPEIALLAAMNIAEVTVRRRPVVALMATGDELVMPGESPTPDQIIASNNFGLAAMIDAAGGASRILPIARDNAASLRTVFDLASDADLIVTIGGASVGDHDLVASVAGELGLEQAFYKIAMRPGKPLMAGHLRDIPMIGLPGNPVSSMVCGRIFVLPALEVMLGLPARAAPRKTLPLARDIAANGNREHYMRAHVKDGAVTVFNRQDSALLSVLAAANALVVRAPGAPAARSGTQVDVIPLSSQD